MARKLRRDLDDFTNRWPPQQDGADSFTRVLGGLGTLPVATVDRARCKTPERVPCHEHPEDCKEGYRNFKQYPQPGSENDVDRNRGESNTGQTSGDTTPDRRRSRR